MKDQVTKADFLDMLIYQADAIRAAELSGIPIRDDSFSLLRALFNGASIERGRTSGDMRRLPAITTNSHQIRLELADDSKHGKHWLPY